MDWITGLQTAIDYVEEHLLDDMDYEAVAAQGFSSSYHFQRVFGILCGFTLGEYIRNRRLSLAGAELATSELTVMDAALKYGYESPDSFTRAFRRFHGILPSEAKSNGSGLRSFSRLVLKISMEGGSSMNYRIEKKPALVLTGFKAHFSGAPYGKAREEQEEQLFVTTRGKQWFLRGASDNGDAHCVITSITDEGYDFHYCHVLDEWTRGELYDHGTTGVDFVEGLELETLTVSEGTYVVLETDDASDPISGYHDLLNQRIQILTEWMPDMGFQLKAAPELIVYHWMPKQERRIQIWLPIEKIRAI